MKRMPPPAPKGLIETEADLALALAELRAADPVVEAMIAVAGVPPLRRRVGGLAGLAWIVASQQVSTAAARAIHGRIEARFPGFDAAEIAAAGDDDLRGCGLSAPKIRAMRAISVALVEKSLDLDALAGLPADEARAALTQVKGVGPWSADIYLLFCLGHPDVWPVGDLALQEGARLALDLRKRPDAARLEKIGRRWRPWRAAAARLLWAYYGAVRARPAPTP
ncbi:MAG TPA: DNA-3-methyladenine glycosylase 2 family protein [Beijerinckiaceae bacterium]|jgi:DNA-3-methyladenine glycosylase II